MKGIFAVVVDRMKNNLLKVKGLFLALADISITVNKQVCFDADKLPALLILSW